MCLKKICGKLIIFPQDNDNDNDHYNKMEENKLKQKQKKFKKNKKKSKLMNKVNEIIIYQSVLYHISLILFKIFYLLYHCIHSIYIL